MAMAIEKRSNHNTPYIDMRSVKRDVASRWGAAEARGRSASAQGVPRVVVGANQRYASNQGAENGRAEDLVRGAGAASSLNACATVRPFHALPVGKRSPTGWCCGGGPSVRMVLYLRVGGMRASCALE